jgi:hypothetical protein
MLQTEKVRNVRVTRDADGDFWLHVKASNKKEGGLNLSALQGPIIRAAFVQWAIDQLAASGEDA